MFKVDLGTGQLSLFAGAANGDFSGDGGPALDARFNNIGGLAIAPGGGLLISDTANQRIRYIAPDSIHLVGDAGQTEFYLPWVRALSGDITITNNPNLSVINMGALGSNWWEHRHFRKHGGGQHRPCASRRCGNIDITGNTAAGCIDLGSSQRRGNIDITGNTAVGQHRSRALATVGQHRHHRKTRLRAASTSVLSQGGGNIDISGNGSATISMGSLGSVTGSITLETTGSGTFDVSGAEVDGDTSLTTDGYTTVDASTADGSTAVTMINDEATMEVALPDGAFTSATPVAFSITNIPGGSVETVDGEMVTHLETYAFDFAIPTLNSAAELNFEIDLAVLDEPDRLSLLDLLHDGALLTLGVRGDAPGAELQLFDVCAFGGPVADSALSSNGWMETACCSTHKGTSTPPSCASKASSAISQPTAWWQSSAVGLAGDYNQNGTVDAADYVVWRDTDGTQAGYDTWRANFGAVSLAIGAGSGSAADHSAVPEPGGILLILVGIVTMWLVRGVDSRDRSVDLTRLSGQA